jgi:hypothetical protein
MSMSFIYPGFLFALSAVSIPILIHLFNFRRFKRIEFTNVRFLKEIKEETTSRNKLKYLLILISRILALVFLVFAFAQPYIPKKNITVNTAENNISIYIDNSFSMEALNEEGNLLEEAKRKAKEIVSAYHLNDKFQLLTNDFSGKHQRLITRDEFLEALNDIKISPSVKNLNEIISRQKAIFFNHNSANNFAYIISDFQKNIQSEITTPDSVINTILVPLQTSQVVNVSVDSVYLVSPIHRAGQVEQLVVRLYNNSNLTAENIPVKLLINGEQKSIGSISIQPNDFGMDTLTYTLTSPGWQKGEVQINDYPVSFDDKYYFSYKVSDDLKILVINGKEQNQYIDAVYAGDPYFKVDHTSQAQINYANFGQYKLILLDELSAISSGLSQELKKYLTNGGSVMLIPSFEADAVSYNAFLSQINADIFQQINVMESKVDYLNSRQEIFKDVFEKIPRELDLPKVKQFFSLSTLSRNSREVLLRLQNGNNFLNAYTYKTGKLYVLASPLQPDYTNLPKHSIFLPLMYRAALISKKDFPLAYTIGLENRLDIEKLDITQKNNFKIAKDKFEIIPDIRNAEAGTQLFISDQVKEAGNYQLIAGANIIAVFSFNYNRKESELKYLSTSELEKLSGKNIGLIEPGKKSLKSIIEQENFGIRLWKICVILALVFLIIEILLIKFWDRIYKPKLI